MKLSLNSSDMVRQPRANAADLSTAVVSWQSEGGKTKILSRYPDDVWIGPALGSLAAAPPASRLIDLTKHAPNWRDLIRAALYASLRHPIRISTTPSFPTLMMRNRAFSALVRFCVREGIEPSDLLTANTRNFLVERTRSAGHLESVVTIVGTLRGAAIHHGQGLLAFDPKYPFPIAKGAKVVAKALWREVHGEDFQGGGDAPYDDDDLTLIVTNAHFYIEELAPDIITALKECLDIGEAYPHRRSNRSQEAKCTRAHKKFLASHVWKHADIQLPEWPPKTLKQVLGHARMCGASSAIATSFATGARRGEILSVRDDCLGKDANGLEVLTLVHYKGRNEINGKPIKLPIDQKVVTALTVQLRIKEQIGRYMHEDSDGVEDAIYTDHLFVQFGRDTEDGYQDGSQRPYTLEGGRLTANALNAQLRSFKKRVVPSIDGGISFTRFRKSVARLVTLSMEGAPLILQTLFGHASYRTTLGYMFASPMINEEMAVSFPEFMASNLRTLYGERSTLMGGGARSIRTISGIETPAAMLTEPEIGMSEEEFVQLGLDMMQNGQMILSLLGPGMYCLKPLLARGPCNDDPAVLLPNIGRCDPACNHHLILGSQRPKLIRQVLWLRKKLADVQTSAPMRAFYSGHEKQLTAVLEAS